jgi:beta-galactosidase
MDMFREPKFAAYAYASQCAPEDEIILKPVTFWARGERNIGGILPLLVLTNCEEVELRYGDLPGKRLKPDRQRFPHLPHAPVIFERSHFSEDELGQWGKAWLPGSLTGFLGGKPVKEQRFVADPAPTTLEVIADAQHLALHDVTRVMVRALDQAGNKLPFFADPVAIEISGAAQLIGPALVPLRAGSTGFWLRAATAGPIAVSVTSTRLGTTTIELAVR